MWEWLAELIDSVESWIAGQSFWVQVPILLGVLLPMTFLLAGLIDRVVERMLRPHTRREVRMSAIHPAGRQLGMPRGVDEDAAS